MVLRILRSTKVKDHVGVISLMSLSCLLYQTATGISTGAFTNKLSVLKNERQQLAKVSTKLTSILILLFQFSV